MAQMVEVSVTMLGGLGFNICVGRSPGKGNNSLQPSLKKPMDGGALVMTESAGTRVGHG